MLCTKEQNKINTNAIKKGYWKNKTPSLIFRNQNKIAIAIDQLWGEESEGLKTNYSEYIRSFSFFIRNVSC